MFHPMFESFVVSECAQQRWIEAAAESLLPFCLVWSVSSPAQHAEGDSAAGCAGESALGANNPNTLLNGFFMVSMVDGSSHFFPPNSVPQFRWLPIWMKGQC